MNTNSMLALLVRVPGQVGINRNAIAHQLAELGSSLPLIGPEPGLDIFAKVADGLMSCWTSRKREEYSSSFVDKGRLRAFLKILY
jgi:hypothetical protein